MVFQIYTKRTEQEENYQTAKIEIGVHYFYLAKSIASLKNSLARTIYLAKQCNQTSQIITTHKIRSQ